MIYSNSRYSDGVFLKAYDLKRDKAYPTVLRRFNKIEATFSYYSWEEGDRIDTLASKFSSNPKFWEQVLDVNPEISNPHNITPGTIIRIPDTIVVVG